MNELLHCHSSRSLPLGTSKRFCAHPNVRVKNNITDAGVCSLCAHSVEAAPHLFRSKFSPASPLKRRGELQLVVARYNENFDWIKDFALPATVYDKSGTAVEHSLPNIGREAHTYLHHICTCYDRLAETTVFLQGNPFDHVPDLHDQIWELDADTGFRDLSNHILAEDAHGEPVHPSLRIDEMHQGIFGTPGHDYYVCHSGACFAVSRENILRHPKSFYENAKRLVIDRKHGPWEIERLWSHVFQNRTTCEGIVTAADAGFFRDLQLLIRSHQAADKWPLVVFDLGLEPSQQAWCLSQPGISLRPVPRLYKPYEQIKNKYWWQSWLKPYFIFNSPFDRVLWIDADCVITGDLGEAFGQISQEPLIVRDATIAQTENSNELYRYLPLQKGVQTTGVNLNAGVVGLCKIRERALLNAWCYGVGWAAINPDKQPLSAFVDQGILLWACLHEGMADAISDDLRWNRPAEVDNSNLIGSAVNNGNSILDEIKRQYSTAGIVHWLGQHKLAKQLSDELEQLFVEGFS